MALLLHLWMINTEQNTCSYTMYEVGHVSQARFQVEAPDSTPPTKWSNRLTKKRFQGFLVVMNPRTGTTNQPAYFFKDRCQASFTQMSRMLLQTESLLIETNSQDCSSICMLFSLFLQLRMHGHQFISLCIKHSLVGLSFTQRGSQKPQQQARPTQNQPFKWSGWIDKHFAKII